MRGILIHQHWNSATRLLSQLCVVIAACLLSFAVSGTLRTAVFLTVFPFAMMLICSRSWFRFQRPLIRIVAFTAAVLVAVYLYRWFIDPHAFLGGVPKELRNVLYSSIALLTLTTSGLTYFAFNRNGRLYKSRWLVFGMLTALLLTIGVATQRARVGWSPAGMLLAISHYEGSDDPYERQELSSLLAACGRESDAEAVWQANLSEHAALELPASMSNIDELHALRWRQTMNEIARRERIIIIMEAHNASRHRQWIEQVLPILHQQGFRDYAAETLAEPTRALRLSGYPTMTTGYYTRDPSFGNLLRTAATFGFDFHAYESLSSDRQQRELGQAENLARLMSARPDAKFVIHVGYAHAWKTPSDDGNLLMAGHLWRLTGIEPYCIYQTWHGPNEARARDLARLVSSDGQPVMLIPPPAPIRTLTGQFNWPTGAVDALVVHPATEGGPANRTHGFPAARRRTNGTWLGEEWPVLVGAFQRNESPQAIALDQVMLKHGEREFVLWLPEADFEIRVFNQRGETDAAKIALND